MTPIARHVLLPLAVCLAACSSVTQPPPPPVARVAKEEPAAPPPPKPPQAETTPKAKAPMAPKPANASPPSRPPATATAAPKPPPAAAAAPKPAPVAQAPAPKAAPLDLKSLEQRLKDTNAIGVLTKLSLKNQVDDLVGKFRTYHEGVRPPTLADLRPGFELLLMKVLSLLQDKDAALAHDVNASREAIWSVLADKQKFAEFS